MIINIRGTSGSGKSFLVRHIMSLYSNKEPVRVEDRKQPLYYIMRNGEGTPELAVLGHYESPCGGCDTITKIDTTYQLIQEQIALGRNVLFEGLLLTNEINRTKELPDCRVVFIEETIETCLAGVNARRQARGEMEPVPTKNTTAKHSQAKRAAQRFEELPGKPVQVFRCNRQQAADLIEEMLGLA